MKKLACISAIALLAACSQEAPEPEADTADQTSIAAVEPAGPLAADGQPTPGNYRITTGDGTVVMEEVRADGTYVDTMDGTVVETGKWNQKSPGEYCSTPDPQYVDEDTPAGEKCNVETVGADGVWTSTNPDGKTARVERVTA